MTNKLRHFAIHIDENERAKTFYNDVFEWCFNAYGQDDFLQIKAIKSEKGDLIEAMQSRKCALVSEKIIALESSIGVENIDNTIEKVISSSGQNLLHKIAIYYVGWIAKFLGTEGNLIYRMQ